MQHFAYAEILEEAPGHARARERAAIERAIGLLEHAEGRAPGAQETVEALLYLHRLWSVLIEDLANPDNDLPQKLRADLISIGLWSMREADRIRLGQSADFGALIEVMKLICEGLR